MNRIQTLLQQSNRSQTELADFLGVRKQVFSDWKAGRNSSYQKKLPEIARFFGISVDELLSQEEPKPRKTMFKENFTRLCAQRRESPSSVCNKIGLAPATYSCWKEDSVPRRATLMRIADYFGVTVESLLEDKKEETPPDPWSQTDDEVAERLLKILHETDEDGRKMLMQMIEAAQKAYNENKGKK